MSITVRIPAPLRKLTGGKGEVEAEGATVEELISNLEKSHPGIKGKLCDESGKLNSFINLYINDADIRYLDELGSELQSGDRVAIVPAIAGG